MKSQTLQNVAVIALLATQMTLAQTNQPSNWNRKQKSLVTHGGYLDRRLRNGPLAPPYVLWK